MGQAVESAKCGAFVPRRGWLGCQRVRERAALQIASDEGFGDALVIAITDVIAILPKSRRTLRLLRRQDRLGTLSALVTDLPACQYSS